MKPALKDRLNGKFKNDQADLYRKVFTGKINLTFYLNAFTVRTEQYRSLRTTLDSQTSTQLQQCVFAMYAEH